MARVDLVQAISLKAADLGPSIWVAQINSRAMSNDEVIRVADFINNLRGCVPKGPN